MRTYRARTPAIRPSRWGHRYRMATPPEALDGHGMGGPTLPVLLHPLIGHIRQGHGIASEASAPALQVEDPFLPGTGKLEPVQLLEFPVQGALLKELDGGPRRPVGFGSGAIGLRGASGHQDPAQEKCKGHGESAGTGGARTQNGKDLAHGSTSCGVWPTTPFQKPEPPSRSPNWPYLPPRPGGFGPGSI